MQKDLKIIKMYAKSLQKIIQKDNQQNLVFDQFQELINIIQSSSKLKKFFFSLGISASQKIDIINTKIFFGGLNKILSQFLDKVFVNNRASDLEEIFAHFETFVKKSQGIDIVYLNAAHDLNQNDLQKIQNMLEREINKKIELRMNIKPELIGGIEIRYGSNLLDGSVQGALSRIKKIAMNINIL